MLMLTVEALKLLPVWVDPEHLVSSAKILMAGHNLRALGVVDAGELIATVTAERLATEGDFLRVRDVMTPLSTVVEANMTTRQVAEVFVTEGIDYAPVVREGQFLGIVTSNMLLRELGRSWDPLTGLSWSDRLREWGIENLKRGNEICILFIDLNDFGMYNKRYGHIVGDKVLRRVATFLSDMLDTDTDVLVRYGGDEFAIGTTRTRTEAEALSQLLMLRMEDIRVSDTEEPVTFCVGLYGGKRTKERENIHFAATLDNLINLASKDCLSKKAPPKRTEAPAQALVDVVEPPAPRVGGPKVVNVFADENAPSALTQVILKVGDRVVSGVSAQSGRPVIESVAMATTKALERAYPNSSFRVADINLGESQDGQRMVSVAGQVIDGDRSILAGGAESVTTDLYTTVAEATIQAFLSVHPGE